MVSLVREDSPVTPKEQAQGKAPVVEPLLTDARETLLWRLDNYP
jgi:hypothetical protein